LFHENTFLLFYCLSTKLEKNAFSNWKSTSAAGRSFGLPAQTKESHSTAQRHIINQKDLPGINEY